MLVKMHTYMSPTEVTPDATAAALCSHGYSKGPAEDTQAGGATPGCCAWQDVKVQYSTNKLLARFVLS